MGSVDPSIGGSVYTARSAVERSHPRELLTEFGSAGAKKQLGEIGFDLGGSLGFELDVLDASTSGASCI